MKMTSYNREKQELAEFIKNKVFGNDFDFNDLARLHAYISAHRFDDENGAFCDYFELGNWFYEAMQLCDLNIGDFLNEFERELELEYREAAAERAEREDDYLRMVGAK